MHNLQKFLIIGLSLLILGLLVCASFVFFAAAIIIWPIYLALKEQNFKFPEFKKKKADFVDAEFTRVE